MIHNGIIENYGQLKQELIRKGYTFKSDTDTEVLANLIEDVKKHGKVSIDEAVRSVVVTRLARGLPDVDAVARHLAIAPRTLQRRLAAKGVSYQQVVDDVRRDAAERLLADPSLAVSQIGYLLGFSEPSAFHRAFKRWHDVTPQEYRQTTQPVAR